MVFVQTSPLELKQQTVSEQWIIKKEHDFMFTPKMANTQFDKIAKEPDKQPSDAIGPKVIPQFLG